jgi:hypothetical protein
MLIRPSKMFMNKEGAGGSGGGTDDGDDDARFSERVNKILHAALTERDKRLEKRLTGLIDASLAPRMDELRQLLVESTTVEPTGQEHQNQQKQTARLTPEEQAMIKKSAQEAAEAKQLAQKWESEAKAEKQRNNKAEERQLLVATLQGRVKPAMLDMVVDQLHSKFLTRDEETGSILWKDADGSVVPAKDGASAWLKSDVGKEFAPPRQVGGAGSRGGGEDGIPTRPGTMTTEALGEIVARSIPGINR